MMIAPGIKTSHGWLSILPFASLTSVPSVVLGACTPRPEEAQGAFEDDCRTGEQCDLHQKDRHEVRE